MPMLVGLAFSGMHNTRETMKSILLATASILAFATAAAADHIDENTPDGVTLGGTGEFGYNDEIEDGFYSEGDVGFVLARELNNGLVAAITFGLGFEDNDEDDFGEDDFSVGDDFVLSLTDRSGQSGMHFGDTSYAAERHWDAAGEMASDGFSEQTDETVLRGDGQFGGISASVSYNLADSDGNSPDSGTDTDNDIDQLSLGMAGSFGAFNVSAAFQEESDAIERAPQDDDPNTDDDEFNEDNSVDGPYDSDSDDDFVTDQIFGIAVGSTFGGADVQVAYALNMGVDDDANGEEVDTSSLGFEVGYPVGPVELGAYYVFEMSDADDVAGTEDDESDPEDSYGVSATYASDNLSATVFHENEQGEDETGFEATYDLGNGLRVNGGLSTEDENFIAAIYDLGDDASLLASFAEVDEAGEAEYKEGTTVALSFRF